MDLAPDRELDAVAELARTIALRVLAPAARPAERDGAVQDTVWATVAESGLTAAIPESFGGQGTLGALGRQIALRELAYGDPGIALACAWSGAVGGLLAEHGTPEQQQLLPTLAQDLSRRCGVALYEGFGRGPHEFATTVEVEGDVVRVRGTKVGVPFAHEADPLVIVGRDMQSGELRAVLTSASAEGVRTAPARPGLALDAARLGRVDVDLTTTAAALLGGPGLDPAALSDSVRALRLLVASALLGTARHAIDYAAKYAVERVAFDRPIAAFQGVSFPLAEALMRIEAATLQVAELADTPSVAGGAREKDVADALAYAGDVAVDATRDAVQSLGGHGFMQDHPVELWYRSATTLAALDTDPIRAPFQPAL